MKKLLIIGIALLTFCTARAQLFGPGSVNGAFWGTLIGGLAGGHRHHGFSGRGAAIGAGVGLATGALIDEANRRNGYYYSGSPYYGGYVSYSDVPAYSPYVYCAPNRYCAAGYYYQPGVAYQSYATYPTSRPNYALGGTVLGAASGALIGAGTHDAGKGAAIGAGAGLLLGAIAEVSARHQERKAAQAQYVAQSQTAVQSAQPVSPPPQLRQDEITSTPVANSTYYWTAPPQIPDAPSVPDAPTF